MNRKKDFRKRRRDSWLRFLRTVGPFAIATIIIGTVIIRYMPPTRSAIPVVYVGFDGSEEDAEMRLAQPSLLLERLSELGDKSDLWGGVERNALILFCDVVGSTGNTTGQGEPLVPEVFVPASRDEFVKCLFDEAGSGTWKPAFKYLNDITTQLSASSQSGKKYYLVIALNVFHPDGPGGMPPQFNRFAKLLKEQWKNKIKDVENVDLTLFLSHDYGQRNYQHSDPENIGSHFKRNFELFLQGKGAELSNLNEITLDRLNDPRQGLAQSVAESAARHEVIQTPVMLRIGDDFGDPVRLCTPVEGPEVGKYFVYRSRNDIPKKVAVWWSKLREKVNHRHWAIENPLDLQRASLLCLQFERLWFTGREPKAGSEIETKLDEILFSEQTVRSTEQNLYEIQSESAAQGDGGFNQIDDNPFRLEWLRKSPEGNADAQLLSWQGKIGSNYHRAAFEVWQALVKADRLDKQTLIAAADLLSGSSYDSMLTNEIVFLRRLATELPHYEFGASFERAIRETIKVHDISNQFAARLNPVLLSEFQEAFEDLENERRVLEDKLFALDDPKETSSNSSTGNWTKGIPIVGEKYKDQLKQHDDLLEEIKAFNSRLIEAPHAFRFAIEVLSNNEDTEFSVESIESYSNLWSGITTNDSLKEQAEGIAEKVTQLEDAHRLLYGSDARLDVYKADKVVVDNIQDVSTGARNTSERLLLNWPSGFSVGAGSASEDDLAEGRRTARQILNGSAIEEAGKASVKSASQEYEKVKDLAANGLLAADSRPLLPMVRRVHEQRVNRLKELTGWPLLAASAKSTHLNWPVDLGSDQPDSAAGAIVEAINEFHYEKSDFQFRRILSDFWGTDINGKPYVDAALQQHDDKVSRDIVEFEFDLAAKKKWKRAGAGFVEKSDELDSWSEARENLIRSTRSAFGDYNFWKNRDKKNTSTVDELLLDPNIPPTERFRSFVESEYFAGNRFLLSIRTPLQGSVKCKTASPQQPDGEQVAWIYRKFDENRKRERDLYLRGWKIRKELPDYKIKGESSSIVISSKVKQTETPRLKFQYGASKRQKTISFLIDCSLSMKTREMNKLDDVKKQLSDVVGKLLQRNDINIRLYAFGATKQVKTKKNDNGENVVDNQSDGKIRYKTKDEWVHWTKEGLGKIPGLKYPGDDSDDWDVIRYSGGNKVDQLNDAIGELAPYGETPLFPAQYLAQKMSRAEPNQFFVVMTDGIDFISGRQINGKAPTTLEPEYKWDVLADKIEALRLKDNTVEFNYASSPEESVKGNSLDINIRKLNRFRELVSDSRLGNESLADFLDRLFPNPVLEGNYDNSKPLLTHQLDFDNKVDQLRVGKYRKMVDQWNLRITSSGKFNLDQPAGWDSSVPLSGNESLDFLYSPDGQLVLIQPEPGFGPKKQIQGVDVEFREEIGYSDLMPDFDVYVRPAFDFWSAENKLTPSPVFAFISCTSPTGKQLLLQDYNETPIQTVSNQRQIVFSELSSTLLERLGFGPQTALQLNLQRSRKMPSWHLFEFFDPGQRFKFFDKQNDLALALQSEDDLKIENVLGNESGDYQIQVRFDEIEGYREYTFSVSRKNPGSDIPLDCWLIQVLDENGRRNGKAFLENKSDPSPIERIYKFDPDQKLEMVQHRFAFENSPSEKFNDGKKGFFGIMRVGPGPQEDFTAIDSNELANE